MLWTMMISLAFAAPCEWSLQPQSVDTARRTITIDGEKYKAKEVAKQLRACDEDDAAEAVEMWQTKRKVSEVALVVGILCIPGLLSIPLVGGSILLVRSGMKDRDQAVVLIMEGRVPAEETQPVVAQKPAQADPSGDPTGETEDPSTAIAADGE